MEILTNYTIEIFFGLVSAASLGFCKKLLNQKKDLERLVAQDQTRQHRQMILDEIEPITEEIRRLKQEIATTNRNLEKCQAAGMAEFEERIDELEENTLKSFDAIINSYKFRLIQLCKTHLKDGHISSDDFDQITEMYKLYSSLGGNGQAKEYYDRVVDLPIRD